MATTDDLVICACGWVHWLVPIEDVGPEEDLQKLLRCRMCKRPSSEMRPAKREEVPRGIALHAFRCVIPH